MQLQLNPPNWYDLWVRKPELRKANSDEVTMVKVAAGFDPGPV